MALSSNLYTVSLQRLVTLFLLLQWNSILVSIDSSNHDSNMSMFLSGVKFGAAVVASAAPVTFDYDDDDNYEQEQIYDEYSRVVNPTNEYNINESYLGVTIRHLTYTLIPSCQQRITQIEIQNRHSKQDVIINPIDLSEEVTRILREREQLDYGNGLYSPNGKSQSPELHTTDDYMDDLPQQLYVSKLPGGTLRIGPGEVGVIPVTFLPQYPAMINTTTIPEPLNPCTSQSDACDDTSTDVPSNNMDRQRLVSPYQQADWEECVDTMKLIRQKGYANNHSPYYQQTQQHRNNLQQASFSEGPRIRQIYENEQFLVSTTVNIDTNRGNFKIPFEVTSIRKNPFGLPDIIYFDVPDTKDDDNLEDMGNVGSQASHSTRQLLWKDNNSGVRTLHSQTDDKRIASIRLERVGLQKEVNDMRIKETLQLFRSLKSKDATAMSNLLDGSDSAKPSIDLEKNEGESEQNISGSHLQQQDSRHDRLKSMDYTGTNMLLRKARIVDRIRRQSDDEATNATERTVYSDCYDLYMRNPDQTSILKVSEVLLSQSKFVTLFVTPDKPNGIATVDVQSFGQRVTDWSNRSQTVFSRSDSSLNIPCDEKPHYVVTMCLKHKEMEKTSNENRLVDTTIDDISTTRSNTNRADKFLSGLPDWIDFGKNGKSLGLLQIKTSQGILFLNIKKASKNVRRYLNSGVIDNNHTCIARRNNSTAFVNDEGAKRILITSPASINFTFVSTSLSEYDISIDFTNISPSPISIMRLAVVLDEQMMRQSVNATSRDDNAGAEIVVPRGVRLKVANGSDKLFQTISPGSSVLNATTLLCAIDWSVINQHYSGMASLTLNGAIVLRGTFDSNVSYTDWINSISSGASFRSNFVVEVPISVRITRGTVGFLAESATLAAPPFWSIQKHSDLLEKVVGTFFPSHPSLLEATLTPREMELQRSVYPKGVDLQFRIFNDVYLDVAVNDVTVLLMGEEQMNPSICERFRAYIVEKGPGDPIDLENFQNMGSVIVRYRYLGPDLNDNTDNYGVYPSICNLRVTTDPPSGIHELPFVVYNGKLAISKGRNTEEVEETLNSTFNNDESWYNIITGLANVLHWFHSTKAGFALRSILRSSTKEYYTGEQDSVLLQHYLYRLAPNVSKSKQTSLNPVLISIGGIEQERTATVPVYITNYNPVPITVTTDVGEVEGQSISLGRVIGREIDGVHYLLNKLSFSKRNKVGVSSTGPRAYSGRFRGHPVDGLKNLLMTNKIAQTYFGRFGYRDDITLSDAAISKFPFLKKIYYQTATNNLRVSQSSPSVNHKCEFSTHPATYGDFAKKSLGRREELVGPVIISTDRKIYRLLQTCWHVDKNSYPLESDETAVILPPGGVARFDVSVRAPSRSNLLKDITQFVATGLVLSTNSGEVLPIIVSFKALEGNLELSQALQVNQREISVPVDLFHSLDHQVSSTIRIPPHNVHSFENAEMDKMIVTRTMNAGEKGVPFYVKSSFSRAVQLRSIDSCNPWFRVYLANETVESDPYLGFSIGTIRSAIPCAPVKGLPKQNSSFPSFFRCALEFLMRQSDILPQECGLAATQALTSEINQKKVALRRKQVNQMVISVRRALLVSEWYDEFIFGDYAGVTRRPDSSFRAKTGRKSVDGTISASVIGTVLNAFDLLKSGSMDGLLSFQTDLRAVVDYNATPDEISPVKRGTSEFLEMGNILSLTIDKTAVKSQLQIPKLLNHKKIYGTRHHNYDQRIVFNATIFGQMTSIRIPLRNPTSVAVRARLGVERMRSQTYYDPPYTQKVHRVEDSPQSWANEQWWDIGGAFFQADFNGNVIRSPYNVSVKSGLGAFISTMNPSVSSNIAFLNGCGPRCGIVEKDYGLPLPVVVADVSPIGAAAASGKIIIGNARNTHRFHGSAGASFVTGGHGPSPFAIPYSALDEVIIPPFGEAELGPIFFRPTGRTSSLDCDTKRSEKLLNSCNSQLFSSTVFVENSLTGVEEVTLEGRALWEKIIFRSPGHLDEFDDVELRHGLPTLVLSDPLMTRAKSKNCFTVKEIVVCNVGDIKVRITKLYLSTHKKEDDNMKDESCKMNGFHILGCKETVGIESFSLLPSQNRSFFIKHIPAEKKKSSHVTLNFELSSWDKPLSQSGTIGFNFISNNVRLGQRSKDTFRRRISLALVYESRQMNSKMRSLQGETATDTDKEYNRLMKILSDQHINPLSHETPRKVITVLLFVVVFVVIAVWIRLLGRRISWLVGYSSTYYSSIVGEITAQGPYWRAMFRCIARVDPSPSELIYIGRDQTRHLLIARLKQLGAMQPQCVNSNGLASRERVGTSGNGGRLAGNSSSGNRSNRSSVNERVRLSDAIFEKVDPLFNPIGSQGLIPCQLGWRYALTRGIIGSSSLQTPPIELITVDLIRHRSQPVPSRIHAVTGRKTLNGDNSSETSGLDSSIDGLSDEESLAAPAVPKIVSYDPTSSSIELAEANSPKGSRVNVKTIQTSEMIVNSDDSSGFLDSFDNENALLNDNVNKTAMLSTDAVIEESTDKLHITANNNKNESRTIEGLEKIHSNNINPDKEHRTINSGDRPSPSASKKLSIKNKLKGSKDNDMAGSTARDRQPKRTTATERKRMGFEPKNLPKNQLNWNQETKDKIEKKSGREKPEVSLKGPLVSTAQVPKATTLTVGDESTNITLATLPHPALVRPPPGLAPPPGFFDNPDASDQVKECPKDSVNETPANTFDTDDDRRYLELQVSKRSSSQQRHTSLHISDTSIVNHAPKQYIPTSSPSTLRQHLLYPDDDDPLTGINASTNAVSGNIPFATLNSPSLDGANIIQKNTAPHPSTESGAVYSSAKSPVHYSMGAGLRTVDPSLSIENDDLSIVGSSHYNSNDKPPFAASSMMDFDVMDFLDHILDESAGSGNDNGNNNLDFFETNGVGGMMLNNIIPAASINPWSMDVSENSSMINNNDNNHNGSGIYHNAPSRAAAYGIAFDSGIGQVSTSLSASAAPYHSITDHRDVLPSLTPSPIVTTASPLDYYSDSHRRRQFDRNNNSDNNQLQDRTL